MPTDSTDSDLVHRSRAGDERAFGLLVNRCWPQVFANVRAVLRDVEDAEDAAQEVFIRAFRHLDELRDPARLSSWLYSIARNVASKTLRQRRLERERLPDYELRADLLERDLGQQTPPWRQEDVRSAIAALASPDRAVVTLFYLVGLDLNHIAAALSIPPGTVKSRLHRSRKQLRERMQTMESNSSRTEAAAEDYGRSVIAGMRGVINWDRLLRDSDSLAGWRSPADTDPELISRTWSRKGDAIFGEVPLTWNDDPGAVPLVVDHEPWSDFELSLLVTPITGGNVQILFRYSETEQSWYLLDFLLGWQAVAISKVEQGKLTKLSVVNHPLEHGQEYDLQLCAREASLTSYIDGKLVNQVTDHSYRSGSVALNVWSSSTAFRDPRYRLLH